MSNKKIEIRPFGMIFLYCFVIYYILMIYGTNIAHTDLILNEHPIF